VLVNLAGSLALWAFAVGRMQAVGAFGGLELQSRDMCVNNCKALLAQHRAVQKA
jgi:hypothetical protein